MTFALVAAVLGLVAAVAGYYLSKQEKRSPAMELDARRRVWFDAPTK